MAKVLYEKDGRIGRITLNRPDVMNAIDDEMPGACTCVVVRYRAYSVAFVPLGMLPLGLHALP